MYQNHLSQSQSQSQSQQQSPIKIQNGSNCFRCNKPGHWIKDCPENTTSPSPISRVCSAPPTTSNLDYPSIHCRCGAGLCEICVSGTSKNPGRKYYRCPGKYEKYCRYFKWCDMLKKEEMPESQPKPFPICGCEAGVSTLLTEENGPNAGRKYFGCHIKKGEGACNFKQWLDDADDTIAEQNNNLIEFEPTDGATRIDALQRSAGELLSEDIEVQVVQMEAHELPSLEDHEQMNGGEDEASNEAHETHGASTEVHPSSVISISENTTHSELANQSSVILQMRMDDSTSTENVQAPVTALVATLTNPITQGLFSHEESIILLGQNARVEEFSPDLDHRLRTRPCLNPPGLLKDRSCEGSIMTGTILQEFEKLAHRLQSDLITLLESMDSDNHKIMMKEAECTFAALDRLQVDYGLFQVRVTEYITQAAALAQINQTFNYNDTSSQELLQRYKNEKSRFDEISRAYCEAKAAYLASSERLSLLGENVFCLKDMLDELETQRSCCEAENATHRDNLLCITKTMSECKERLQIAYHEAEEALKISAKREIEVSSVKSALEKARAQLRK